MGQRDIKSMNKLMKLLAKADQPFNEQSVAMDCNDGCEDIAEMAERVASGENLSDIFPEYADHIDQIGCCKEEFEALVDVIRAETKLEAAEDSES